MVFASFSFCHDIYSSFHGVFSIFFFTKSTHLTNTHHGRSAQRNGPQQTSACSVSFVPAFQELKKETRKHAKCRGRGNADVRHCSIVANKSGIPKGLDTLSTAVKPRPDPASFRTTRQWQMRGEKLCHEPCLCHCFPLVSNLPSWTFSPESVKRAGASGVASCIHMQMPGQAVFLWKHIWGAREKNGPDTAKATGGWHRWPRRSKRRFSLAHVCLLAFLSPSPFSKSRYPCQQYGPVSKLSLGGDPRPLLPLAADHILWQLKFEENGSSFGKPQLPGRGTTQSAISESSLGPVNLSVSADGVMNCHSIQPFIPVLCQSNSENVDSGLVPVKCRLAWSRQCQVVCGWAYSPAAQSPLTRSSRVSSFVNFALLDLSLPRLYISTVNTVFVWSIWFHLPWLVMGGFEMNSRARQAARRSVWVTCTADSVIPSAVSLHRSAFLSVSFP